MSKWLTVGIPAYKAEGHICDALASIQIQTIVSEASIIIAKDNPDDDYEFVKERFPDLDITILECEKNTGPGLARQRCADACKTEWITWMDADDVFFTPFALEYLKNGITTDVIEVQGIFYQEITDNPDGIRTVPRNGMFHPWCHARLYNVEFLRKNDIRFTELRANEDAEFNFKIRMTIDGTKMKINIVEAPVYFWRTGSEHSITRIGIDEDKIPQYNFDLCMWGFTIAAINAIKFVRRKNPFNGAIIRFATEVMIGEYFNYIECCVKKPIFAEQTFFNAKRFYNECFKNVELQMDEEALKKTLGNMYTVQLKDKLQDLKGTIPEITFWEFMDKVRTEEYGGEEEFKQIRAKLPEYIIENDKKTGVAMF